MPEVEEGDEGACKAWGAAGAGEQCIQAWMVALALAAATEAVPNWFGRSPKIDVHPVGAKWICMPMNS